MEKSQRKLSNLQINLATHDLDFHTKKSIGIHQFDARTRRTIMKSVGVDSGRCRDPCQRLRHLKPIDVLREYSENALAHGIQFFSRKNLNFLERLSWTIAVVVCTAFAAIFIHTAWSKYVNSPIVTTVETTFYPLYKLPFPAVTLCNSNNVRRSVAEKLLLRHLQIEGEPNGTLKEQLWHVMSILSKLQYPFFYFMNDHIKHAKSILPLFATLNITSFMLQVMPPCEDMFDACFWQGSRIDCCREFHLQRYEGGFCYSFNSLTADAMQFCDTPVYSEEPSSGSTVRRCLLRHNTAYGTATGLEVYLKLDNGDGLGDGQRLSEGVTVLVHEPNSFPDEGRSLFVPKKMKGVAKVMPSLTESDSDMRKSSPELRQCYFPDEQRLLLSRDYKYDTCLLQCRLLYIADTCGCVPYFFSALANISECNVTNLQCIMENGVHMRFFRPPEGSPGFEKSFPSTHLGLNCSECLPTCHDSKYDMDSSTTASSKQTRNNLMHIDVYYKDLSAVKYRRELAFGKNELLVSMGGIVSLFLGVSILSVIELLYYMSKLATVMACRLQMPAVSAADKLPPSVRGKDNFKMGMTPLEGQKRVIHYRNWELN